MGTSLEIFILALVEQGIATPYDLKRAGISVGAAHPALQRLLKRKLLVRGKAGARGRSAYQLTRAGREALGSWQDLLRAYGIELPTDVESVLRVVALAWAKGKKRDGLELLQRAAATWAETGKKMQAAPKVPGHDVSDLVPFYNALIRALERGRFEGERQALRRMITRLQRSRN